MNRNGQSRIGTLFFTVLVILLIAGGLYFLSQKSTTVMNPSTPNTEVVDTQTEEETDSVVATWDVFRTDTGIALKYPGYIKIGPDTEVQKTNLGPTVTAYHSITFTPNPNADFETLSASIEIAGLKDFVLNLGDRFISYDQLSETWYVNKNSLDKPSASSPTYKNLYKAGNEFNPNVYTKTMDGHSIFGVFEIGDDTRGSRMYLVPVLEQGRMVIVTVRFNSTALEGSTKAIKSLNSQFASDLPHLLKSINASE